MLTSCRRRSPLASRRHQASSFSLPASPAVQMTAGRAYDDQPRSGAQHREALGGKMVLSQEPLVVPLACCVASVVREEG